MGHITSQLKRVAVAVCAMAMAAVCPQCENWRAAGVVVRR